MEKAQRIEGDPEGYEPEFWSGKDVCHTCALRTLPGCFKAPCYWFKRPEKRKIHYVKEGTGA